MESEAITSNEVELGVIQSSQIKPYLTKKVKQFQAGCIKNYFSEWASYTMDKMLLESMSGLSLEFFYIKQPNYHTGMEMRLSFR